jgi:hypothetical protein
MAVIVEHIVVLLRLLQPVANFRQELIAHEQLLMHHREACLTGGVGTQSRQIPAVDHTERRCLDGSLLRRVVAEFRPRQPL